MLHITQTAFSQIDIVLIWIILGRPVRIHARLSVQFNNLFELSAYLGHWQTF